MERVGVVGISWRRGGSDALAAFTLPPEDRAAALSRLAAVIGARELLYLATCNRVEVAFVADDATPIAAYRPRVFEALGGRPPEPGEAERVFKAWAGEGAAEHLFLVAAGLDSARIGETEIAHQLKQSLELSRAAGLAGPRLERVAFEALQIAGRVHHLTQVGGGRVSLAEVALDHIRGRVAEMAGAVALVGVGSMSERCALGLRDEGVPFYIVNRTLPRAQALAKRLGGEALSLDALRAHPPALAALMSATAAPGAILDAPALEALVAAAPRPPLIVDMAIPPDVPGALAQALGCDYVDMAAITQAAEANRAQRLQEVAEARLLVDEGLMALRRDHSERLMVPLIKALRERGEAQAERSLQRLLRRELSHIEGDDEAALRRFTQSLIKGLLHIPTAGLRALAFEAGPEAVQAFLTGVDGDLADAMAGWSDAALHTPEPDEEIP